MGLLSFVGGSPATPNVVTAKAYTQIQDVVEYSMALGAINAILLHTPKGAVGIGGFQFDVALDDEIQIENDVTMHWAEDNTYINDHIAQKPYLITMRGYVGELTLPGPNLASPYALSSLASKLGTTQAYLGKYTPQAAQKLENTATGALNAAQNYANQIAQYANQGIGLLKTIGLMSAGPTKQQKALAKLAALSDAGSIFDVVTPWGFFKTYALKSVRIIQTRETETRSDVICTMQAMRFIDDTPQGPMLNQSGRAGIQAAPQSILGNTPGFSAKLASVLGQGNTLGV